MERGGILASLWQSSVRTLIIACMGLAGLAGCGTTLPEAESEVALPQTDYGRRVDPFTSVRSACGLTQLTFTGVEPEMFAGSQLTVRWEAARFLTGYCRMMGPIPGGQLEVGFQGTDTALMGVTLRAGPVRVEKLYTDLINFAAGRGIPKDSDDYNPFAISGGYHTDVGYKPSGLIWEAVGQFMRQVHPQPRNAPLAYFRAMCRAPWLIGDDKKDPVVSWRPEPGQVWAGADMRSMPSINKAPPRSPRRFPLPNVPFYDRPGPSEPDDRTGLYYFSAWISRPGEPLQLGTIPVANRRWRSAEPCPATPPDIGTPARTPSEAVVIAEAQAVFQRFVLNPENLSFSIWTGSSPGYIQAHRRLPYDCAETTLNDTRAPDVWDLDWGVSEETPTSDLDLFLGALLDSQRRVIATSAYARVRVARSGFQSVSCNTAIFD